MNRRLIRHDIRHTHTHTCDALSGVTFLGCVPFIWRVENISCGRRHWNVCTKTYLMFIIRIKKRKKKKRPNCKQDAARRTSARGLFMGLLNVCAAVNLWAMQIYIYALSSSQYRSIVTDATAAVVVIVVSWKQYKYRMRSFSVIQPNSNAQKMENRIALATHTDTQHHSLRRSRYEWTTKRRNETK